MKRILCLLLVMTLLCGVVGCEDEQISSDVERNDVVTPKETEEKKPKSYSEYELTSRIEGLYDDIIKSDVAKYYGIKFVSSFNFTDFSVKNNGTVGGYTGGGEYTYEYVVTAYGNISGYTDNYKIDYTGPKPFRATMEFRGNLGDVWSVEVYSR